MSIMRNIVLCLCIVAVASFEVCHDTCVNETETGSQDDKLDIAIAKITKIMKETCTCPMYSRPADCLEVLKNGNTVSDVYTIYPKKKIPGCESWQVYCDMDTDGGGWIVIQRRGHSTVPHDFFNQDWKAYKTGFGDIKQEFWIGNDNIFAITNQGQYAARFDMRNSQGVEKYETYNTFSIEDESKLYKLTIGKGEGTAGDSLSTHNGRFFYTKDKINIPAGHRNYRKVPNSGWWFNVFPSTNLNGLKTTKDKDGIVWAHFGGYSPPLQFSEIKLRPKTL